MKAVVTADDFGLNKNVNQAIQAILKQKKINYISLIVNLPYSQQAAKKYLICRLCPVGLHFNLTEGKPVSKPELIPSLINKNKQFYPLPEFLLKLILKKINLTEMEQELESQIKAMKFLGLTVSHLNSHQNIHLLSPINRILNTTAKKYQIRLIRQPKSVLIRLRHFPLRYLILIILIKLTNYIYKDSRIYGSRDFEETLIHPGTSYDRNLFDLILKKQILG